MKKSLKVLSLLLAVIFLVAGTSILVCYADDPPVIDAGEGGDGGDGGGDSGSGSGEISGGGDSGSGSGSGEISGGGDSGSGSGEISGGDSGSGSGEISGGGDSGSGDYDSGSDSNYSGGSVQDNDYDSPYYGDASNYDYNITAESGDTSVGSATSNTPKYNSSGMSAADAAPNEWSNIELDEKTVKTGVKDFSSIQEDTSTEQKESWILYLGYALLGLAALGILYFIIATIAHRQAYKKSQRLEQRRAASAARSANMRAMYEDDAPTAPAPRTTRFADDDYPRSRGRVSSRSDTDEVYVPRRIAKKTR